MLPYLLKKQNKIKQNKTKTNKLTKNRSLPYTRTPLGCSIQDENNNACQEDLGVKRVPK